MNNDERELTNQLLFAVSQVVDQEHYEYVKGAIVTAVHSYEIRKKQFNLYEDETLPDVWFKKTQDLINYFKVIKMSKGLTKESLQQYEIAVRQLCMFLSKELPDITSDDIIFFLVGYQIQNGTMSSTMENKRLLLSSVFSTLYKHQKIDHNPIEVVEKIKFKQTVKQPLTEEEIERLKVAAAGDKRSLMMVYFLLDTGVKISEFCNIKLGDIDFQNRSVKILGKGDKERVVYYGGKTAVRIEEYLKTRKDLYGGSLGLVPYEATPSAEWKSRPLLASLRKPYGSLCPDSAGKVIKKLGIAAGIERLHPHLFRATYATMLTRKGVPIEVMAEYLGHANLGTIQRYVITSDEHIKTEIQRVGGIV